MLGGLANSGKALPMPGRHRRIFGIGADQAGVRRLPGSGPPVFA
jgi:hypothetical protein